MESDLSPKEYYEDMLRELTLKDQWKERTWDLSKYEDTSYEDCDPWFFHVKNYHLIKGTPYRAVYEIYNPTYLWSEHEEKFCIGYLCGDCEGCHISIDFPILLENGKFSYFPTMICVNHLEYFRFLFESYPGSILRTTPVEKNSFRNLQESLRLQCQRLKISEHLYYEVFYELKKELTKKLLYEVFRKFSNSGNVPQIINVIMSYCFEN